MTRDQDTSSGRWALRSLAIIIAVAGMLGGCQVREGETLPGARQDSADSAQKTA